MHFISYLPGSCGDIICAMVHPESYLLVEDRIVIDPKYGYLKCTEYVHNYHKYDEFIANAPNRRALPSHLLYYHIKRNHNVIYIDNTNEIDWCNDRIKVLYPNSSVVNGQQQVLSSKRRLSAINLYSNQILTVTDILTGKATEKLRKWVETPIDIEIYDKWRKNILNLFPFNQRQ